MKLAEKLAELIEAQDRLRRREYPDFFTIAKGLISAKMATLDGGDSGSFAGEPDRHKVTCPLSEANIIGSELPGTEDAGDRIYGRPLHKPVLDIDIPIWAYESSTPGHWHLIIDKEMTWDQYRKLLTVMGEVGILEPGFVSAAKSRKASWIRTPWTPKHKGDNDQ